MQVLVKDAWIPEDLRAGFSLWTPKSLLGATVMKILRAGHLPREMAQELFDRIQATVVLESSLAVATMRPLTERGLRGPCRFEDLGIVSRKVITTAGVTYLTADFAAGANDCNLFKFHGIGTTNTAEASGDTALAAESTTNLNPDSTRATGSQSSSTNTYTTVGTLTADGAIAAVEHGLFSQAATGGGTLWDRSVFSTVTLASGDSIQTTYVLTASAGG